MKRYLSTLDVLHLLEVTRNKYEPHHTGSVQDSIAHCQDIIAQAAGIEDQSEWLDALSVREMSKIELARCKAALKAAGFQFKYAHPHSYTEMYHCLKYHTPTQADEIISQIETIVDQFCLLELECSVVDLDDETIRTIMVSVEGESVPISHLSLPYIDDRYVLYDD